MNLMTVEGGGINMVTKCEGIEVRLVKSELQKRSENCGCHCSSPAELGTECCLS